MAGPRGARAYPGAAPQQGAPSRLAERPHSPLLVGCAVPMAAPLPVLLVAHEAPPLGGPGVQRVGSWMRHWPALGIEPVLLTAPAEEGARFHGYPLVAGTDAMLADRTVVRVATPPAGGLAGLLRALHAPARLAWTLSYRRVREPESPWPKAAVPAGVAEGRAHAVRAVVSTSQPYATHEA